MSKHKARIIQKIYVARYSFGFGEDSYWHNSPSVYERSKYKEDKVIWVGELDSPVLKESDQIRIEELNKTHTIKIVIRSTEGGYVYVTDERITIEDEETELSKTKATEKERIYKQQESKKGEKKPWWSGYWK